MLYTVGMFLNFSLTNIVFEIYYYNIYKNKQTINKIKLIGIFFLKLSLLLLAFIVADYDSILINLTLYLTNIFPLLFIYNDTLKNKILNYLIINYYFAVIEMLISALFVIILYASRSSPQKSLLIKNFIPNSSAAESTASIGSSHSISNLGAKSVL